MSRFMEDGNTIGIDKKWPYMFLLRLQEIFPKKNLY